MADSAITLGTPFTDVTVTTTDGTLTTIATEALDDDTVYLFEVSSVARRTDSADRGATLRRALFFREAAGGATLQGSVDTTFTEGNSGYLVTLAASGNNTLIQVTGIAAHTVDWKVSYRFIKVA